MLLHTTLAIGLVMLLQDRREFLTVDFHRTHWTKELLFYLICMVTAAYGAAVSVGALWLNCTPVQETKWRSRAFLSGSALMLINVSVLEGVHFTLDVLIKNESRVASPPATVFITVIGMGLTLGFNAIYFWMFGCCVCLQCRGRANAKLLAHHWGPRNSRFLAQQVTLASPVAIQTESTPKAEASPRREHQVRASPSQIRKSKSAPESQPRQKEEKKTAMRPSMSSSLGEEHRLGHRIRRSGIQSLDYERNVACPEEVSMSPDRRRQSRVGKWDTKRLVETGTFVLSRTSRVTSPRRPPSHQCEIIPEESEKEMSEVPSPTKTVTGPDVAAIVRRSLTNEGMITTLKPSTWSLQSLWNAVREEPGHFRYSVWIKTAFLTSVIVLIYTCIRTMSVLFKFSQSYSKNKAEFEKHISELESCSEEAFEWSGIDGAVKKVILQVYLIADAVMMDLKHTVWPGYTLGTLVGLCSLVAVLIQHKRISLAVTDGLRAFHEEAASSDQEVESPWPSFQRKYPILGACFFLAILSSTAVVQLHVVGITVSILLGMVMHISRLSVLMDHFGFYLLAYVLVFLVDIMVMRFFRASLISNDGAHIKHPRWFNFIIVVLSMVHLVIGLLYALWRALYLLITTIFVLNRLDVSLFTIGKSLDNGHNAFMSMLVLTVLIQEDHDSFSRKSLQEQNSPHAPAPASSHKTDNWLRNSEVAGGCEVTSHDMLERESALTLETPFYSPVLTRNDTAESYYYSRHELGGSFCSYEMDSIAEGRFLDQHPMSNRITVLIDKEVKISSERPARSCRPHQTARVLNERGTERSL